MSPNLSSGTGTPAEPLGKRESLLYVHRGTTETTDTLQHYRRNSKHYIYTVATLTCLPKHQPDFLQSSADFPFESLQNCRYSDLSQSSSPEGRRRKDIFTAVYLSASLFNVSAQFINIRFPKKYIFYGQKRFILPHFFYPF